MGVQGGGYAGTLDDFKAANPVKIVDQLAAFIENPSGEQERVWRESIPELQRIGRELTAKSGSLGLGAIILEYRLPLEARRPDVILLLNGIVIAIELKSASKITRASLDQVRAYTRDLSNYHRACAAPRPVHAVLVPGGSPASAKVSGVHVTSMENLAGLIATLAATPSVRPITLDEFLDESAYRPLPTLVQAAREIFNRREVRDIWRARATTDPAIACASEIAKAAAASPSRHLILLTGIPGSGKTLVGLRLVHSSFLDEIAVARGGEKPSSAAVFLSGNGPLVEVLQYLLKEAGGGGKTFVRGVKDYVRAYAGAKSRTPPEHVLVFDEAQRAWDQKQVERKHQHDQWGANTPKSEPEHFIEFAERIPEWAVVVGLIGAGQEIHVGEEAGLAQWRRAMEQSPKSATWTVHGAASVAQVFEGSPIKLVTDQRLDLNTEIRFHLVPHVEDFVASVLEAEGADTAATVAKKLTSKGVALLVTRNLDEAKAYARERYGEDPAARFGLLASSKDKSLPQFGVENGFQATKLVKLGPFYADGEERPLSCRRLEKVVTEFGAQGLELDLAVVCWGTDFMREGDAWSNRKARGYRERKPTDALQLRVNAYRVLLTRGRDGVVVFVPELEELDETFAWLRASGFSLLSESASAEAASDLAMADH